MNIRILIRIDDDFRVAQEAVSYSEIKTLGGPAAEMIGAKVKGLVETIKSEKAKEEKNG
jgi:hypothetical protein